MTSLRRDSRWRYAVASAGGALALALAGPCCAQSFKDALGQAYLYNPQLASSRASLRQSDEGVPRALSGWRPSVSVLGEVGKAVVSDSLVKADPQHRIPQAAVITLSQPLYSGGRVSSQVQQAKAQVLAQRAQLRSTEATVLLQAGTAYLDVARDQRTVGLNRANVALLDRTLHASEQQYATGDITLADVAQARARDADGRSQLAMAEAQLSSSRANYEQQVGSLPGSLEMPRLFLPLPRSRQAAAEQATAGNFAVRAARETFAASEAAVGVAEAGLRPNVSLTGNLERLKDTDVQALHQRDNIAEADLVLNVPLYQGGGISAQVRAAKEGANQSRLQIDVSLREARREALSAWDMLAATAVQVSAARTSVAANEVATRGVVRQQSVGARTLLDVLNAQQELFSANVRLVSAQHDQFAAALQILNAVGGLGAEELRLPITIYDPVRHFNEVRGRWYGTTPSP